MDHALELSAFTRKGQVVHDEKESKLGAGGQAAVHSAVGGEAAVHSAVGGQAAVLSAVGFRLNRNEANLGFAVK